jgi:hypothetical protein
MSEESPKKEVQILRPYKPIRMVTIPGRVSPEIDIEPTKPLTLMVCGHTITHDEHAPTIEEISTPVHTKL